MKILSALAAAAMLAASPSAVAQETPAAAAMSVENLRVGRLIISAEGRRIGRIESLVGERGAPTAVRLIFNGKFVTIPVSTLSAADRPNVFKTSLTNKELL